jgi:hypothetical protein
MELNSAAWERHVHVIPETVHLGHPQNCTLGNPDPKTVHLGTRPQNCALGNETQNCALGNETKTVRLGTRPNPTV